MTFKSRLGNAKGEGKITQIDAKTMKWTALFGDKEADQPLGGLFGKDFTFTFTHDGKGTGKFIAGSDVLKPGKEYKLLGPIGTKDKKILRRLVHDRRSEAGRRGALRPVDQRHEGQDARDIHPGGNEHRDHHHAEIGCTTRASLTACTRPATSRRAPGSSSDSAASQHPS